MLDSLNFADKEGSRMNAKRFFALITVLFFSVYCSMAQAPPVFDTQLCFGGSGTDIAGKVIPTIDGGYIFAGSTTSINGDVTINRGANDFWVIRTNANGNREWQKTFGGSGNDIATAVLELSNNDILVAGYTYSNNGQVSGNHGGSDIWLIRLNSSGTLLWKRSLGGTSNEYCYSLALASDSGFILAGSSTSNNGNVTGNHGSTDFWIVKTDGSGNIQWQKSLGGSGIEECYSIHSTFDGGYIAAGYTNSNDGQVSGNHGNNDFWIVKLNATGNLLWQKCLGGTLNEVATVVLQNSSGRYVVGGYSNSSNGDVSNNYGSSDYWMAILDSSNGNMISEKTYGGSNSEIVFDVLATANNGLLIAGGSNSNNGDVNGNHGSEDIWLIKTDSIGNIVWSRTYGGTSVDRPASVLENSDGGFTTLGYSYSNNSDVSGSHGEADIWFLKLSCFAPVSDFEIAADTVCLHTSVNFTNTSVHSALHEWKIDDALYSLTTNSSLQFNTTGTFKITLYSYTCYAVDSLSKFITVVDYPIPFITSSVSYLCEGNSGRLSTIEADRYAWNNGATSREIVVDSGGNYSVIVTKYGCNGSTSLSLDEYQLPQIELGNDTSICSGLSITLSIPSGFERYLWQDGSTSNSFIADTIGVYFVTVSDDFCSSSDSILLGLISNPVPTIVSSNPYVCTGNSETLSTIAGDSYLWSSGEVTSTIQVSTAGFYSVTVTTNGCSDSASFAMNQHDSPLISLGNDTTICSGNSFSLHAPSGYQSYAWQNNSTDSIFSVGSSGYYHVTVSNGYCSSTDSIFVVIITCIVPTANFISSQQTLCEHSCLNFIDQSRDAVSWSWFFPGASVTTSNVQYPTGICYDSAGVFPVYLIVYSASGSSSTIMRQNYINVNAIPAAPTITANSILLTSSLAPGYQWFFNNNFIHAANARIYNALQNGNYSVMITGANGCSAMSLPYYIGITGIDATSEQANLSIYPNPSSGIFYVQFSQNKKSKKEIEVTDLTGKRLVHSIVTAVDDLVKINLEQFSNGIYFLKIKSESTVSIQKLVIEK